MAHGVSISVSNPTAWQAAAFGTSRRPTWKLPEQPPGYSPLQQHSPEVTEAGIRVVTPAESWSEDSFGLVFKGKESSSNSPVFHLHLWVQEHSRALYLIR
ncbi:UNVERIFIED_CONTAM: hypothetical protein K2H54_013279 [Gekko kuhli]